MMRANVRLSARVHRHTKAAGSELRLNAPDKLELIDSEHQLTATKVSLPAGWDGTSTDFAITTINVPDRLDVLEVRAREEEQDRQAEERSGLAVDLIDERNSSKEADRRFAARRRGGEARKRDAAALDAVAAEIIVERWLQHVGPSSS